MVEGGGRMKRPQGFDPPARRPAPVTPTPKPQKAPAPKASAPKASAPKNTMPSTDAEERAVPTAPRPPKPPRQAPPARAPRPDAAAKRELKRAAAARRRYEKLEVRRFTRRQRSRRRVLLALGASVLVLAIMLAVAVFSPIMALRHVIVQGTSRLDVADVESAVDDQLGTPLALVDLDRITRNLGKLPLIESYTTETVPPDTLVIQIAERHPVGVIENGDLWDQVDAAGVTVASSSKRPSNLPILTIDGDVHSVPFVTAATVLRSLPGALEKRVHSVSASTADDVEFVLTGGDHVRWGSDERPSLKYEVLQVLMKQGKREGRVLYDVSSPTTASYSYL